MSLWRFYVKKEIKLPVPYPLNRLPWSEKETSSYLNRKALWFRVESTGKIDSDCTFPLPDKLIIERLSVQKKKEIIKKSTLVFVSWKPLHRSKLEIKKWDPWHILDPKYTVETSLCRTTGTHCLRSVHS